MPCRKKERILLALFLFFQNGFITAQNLNRENDLSIVFSHSRNFCNEPFYLELHTGNDTATIIYTLNSSVPKPGNGSIYIEPVLIETTTVFKAIAFSGSDTTNIITHTFIFPEMLGAQGKSPPGFPTTWGGSSVVLADYEMDPEIINHPEYKANISGALKSLPCLSLTMDVKDWFDHNNGLYVGYPNTNISREKAVTAEFIFNDENQNFAVECGVQNQGGTSIVDWKIPKQSMRLLFKEMYGPKKLNYKLFPDSDIKSINTLVLDGLLYSWLHPWDDKQRKTTLYFRDQLASDMQNNMGWNSFHGIYVHLFINGLYWGMYDLHERPDEDFMQEYLEADKDDFDIIKHNPNDIVHGTNAAYTEMINVARNGLITPVAFKNFQKYIDLPAFIDYMILNFYLGNYDWAHQNYYAAQNKVQNTGFRFYTWDAEHVMRYSDLYYNNLDKNDKGGPTEIHTFLKQNREYRMMFADAVYKHFFNDGALTPESFEKSFLLRKNETESAVILESARWGDFREDISGITYTKHEHWIPEVNRVLEDYIPRRRNIVISQMQGTNPKLFPSSMPPVFNVYNPVSKENITVELINPNQTEGDIYYTLDGSDPRKEGGAVGGLKYTNAIYVQNSTLIKARILSKYSSEWSALTEKSFVFGDIYGRQVVITEIMYNPENGYPEFIELVNTGDSDINLEGFVFSKGIDFTFQAGNFLSPDKGIVLTNDSALFRNIYGFSAFGQYNKRLNNGGETIILQNRFNQVVDSVAYSDTIPWPITADGEGYSLELIDPESDNSVFSNWKVSVEKKGTPVRQPVKPEIEAVFYPNPFGKKLYFEIGTRDLLYETFIVDIFNLTGSKVRMMEIICDDLRLQIPTADLTGGVYVIQIRTKQKTEFLPQTFKALKVR